MSEERWAVLFRLYEWPAKTWHGFILYIFALRGFIAVLEVSFDRHIEHGFGLVFSVCAISILTAIWPRKPS